MGKWVLLILLAIFLAVPAGFVSAQTETATAKVLSEWLGAFNSGDAGRMTAFWKKYGSEPPQSRVEGDQRLHDMTGGFSVLKITEDTGSRLVVSMKDGHGGYAEITLELASTDPPVVKSIFGHPAPPPQVERAPAGNDAELVAQVRAHAAELLAKDELSGAVLIARDGKPILDEAWGMADREKKTKNTVDTQFCLGSMNKMFTAVAVLQLVQAGKLSLDGVVADYWPSYPNRDLARRVKIRQLLEHTGGTGDIFTPEFEGASFGASEPR